MGKPVRTILRVFLISVGIVLLGVGGLVGYATYLSNVALEKASVPADGQVMGNQAGSLTVVEFVDYRCHFCPIMNKTMEQTLALEPDVRVIIRPVAGVDDLSEGIATFVLATTRQGKFVELHNALMNLPSPPDLATAKSVAASIGVDVARAEKDATDVAVTKAIEENQKYVLDSGFVGIPALIIGGWRYQPSESEMKSVNNLRMIFADAFTRLTQEQDKK